jgi:hypothetical protein
LRYEPATPRLLQQLLWKAACIYAQAAGKLKPNASVEGRRLGALQVHYQDRAVQLLHRALGLSPSPEERGAFWRENIETEPALRRLPGLDRLRPGNSPAGK